MKIIKAGIIGATGYVGSELLRILYHHPEVEIKVLSSKNHNNQVFSSIYENFNKDIANTLNRFADIIKDDNDYLETIALKKTNKYCLTYRNGVKISKDAFNEHRAILSRILRNTIKKIKGNLKNIEKKHVDDII